MRRQLDDKRILEPTARPLIELRGPSGRLYGRLDLERLTIEVKRKNEPIEHIDLAAYVEARIKA